MTFEAPARSQPKPIMIAGRTVHLLDFELGSLVRLARVAASEAALIVELMHAFTGSRLVDVAVSPGGDTIRPEQLEL